MTEPLKRRWLNRIALPFGLVLLAALGGGAVWLRLHLAIDRCVDAGGKWGYADRRCTFVEPEIALQPAAPTPVPALGNAAPLTPVSAPTNAAAVTPAPALAPAPAPAAPAPAPAPEPTSELVEPEAPSVTAGWR